MNSVYNFCDFARYPITIFNKPMQFFLSFVIPFGLVISVPVQIVLKGTWSAWPVIGIIILAIRYFNKKGENLATKEDIAEITKLMNQQDLSSKMFYY